jgi:hypothetical protein
MYIPVLVLYCHLLQAGMTTYTKFINYAARALVLWKQSKDLKKPHTTLNATHKYWSPEGADC